MDKAKRDEFVALLTQLASIPRPLLDYSKLSNATFAGLQFIHRLMEIQATFMLIFRRTGALPASKQDIRDLLIMSLALTPQDLADAFENGADGELVRLLADLKIEELFIGAELALRLADKRIGTALIIAPFFTDASPSEKWLTKELKVDKIKAYRLYVQEERDIRQSSLTRAYELARDLESPSYEPGPLPPFPLELRSPSEASFWNVGLQTAWKKGHETLRKGLVPVLERTAEGIPDQVRDYRREQWRKIKEREQLFKDHESQIASEVHPEPHEKGQHSPDISARMFDVLKEAKKHRRWGDKAIKAFKFYLDGKTEDEASRLAGIDPRTFRNYISRLQKTFSSKN